MTNKKTGQIDMESIKAYERSMRANQEPSKSEEIMDFDTWWAMRQPLLKQPQHLKEILKADSKARGLLVKESMDRWDWAARQFGLTF